MGGYSESGKIIFGESGGSTFLGANIKREGLSHEQSSGLFYFRGDSDPSYAIGQPPITSTERSPSPRRIAEVVNRFQKAQATLPSCRFHYRN